MERAIEGLLYASRWLLVPFYLGLIAILVLSIVSFSLELWTLSQTAALIDKDDMILSALTMIDLVLVASLVVMVVISGYENFVSRFDFAEGEEKLGWLGKLDAGSLKLRVASSIVAISSINLLKYFMNIEQVPNDKLMWLVIVHITFVVSTLAMAVVEWIQTHTPNTHGP